MNRIEDLMKHETAGDPMTGLKWTRRTTQKIAKLLKKLGIKVSPNTVARLLKKLGYSLRVNAKKIESGSKNPPTPEERNQQFEHISQKRETFARNGNPIISIDTKKKELIGNFKNNGRSWEEEPVPVNDHDFPSDADGIAVPYGIYDTQANRGFVMVGIGAETPAFAVDAIEYWWANCGRKSYPEATELLILADGGGCNGARSRVFKYRLQSQLCDRYDLEVTVCHYPPGASKWNPIEHRLFSEISKNWAGRPLDTYQTALNYIRTTRTASGLRTKARLSRKRYRKGEKVPENEMKRLALSRHRTLPNWNYSLYPRKCEIISE